MINAAPETHDFRFTHEGVDYCIGYQSVEGALACSKLTGDEWAWVTIVSGVDEWLKPDQMNPWTPEQAMDKLLLQVNETVFTGDGLPDGLSAELKSLLLIIRDDLVYSSAGISRK